MSFIPYYGFITLSRFCKTIIFFDMFWWVESIICFRDYVRFDNDLKWFCDWISHWWILVDWVYWTVFYFRKFTSYFQKELCQNFDRFFKVRIILLSCCHIDLGTHFSNGFWYWCMPCGFLGGVLENRDLLKDTRRLPRVRHPGWGVKILLVSKSIIFNIFLPFYMSLVDIDC